MQYMTGTSNIYKNGSKSVSEKKTLYCSYVGLCYKPYSSKIIPFDLDQ